MSRVQIAFFEGAKGRWIRQLISLLSGRWAHCEIVVDGVGYTPKHRVRGLYRGYTEEHQGDNAAELGWELVDVPWDADRVYEYLHAHRDIKYDFPGLFGCKIPFITHHKTKQICSEFLANISTWCDCPLFHGATAGKLTPTDLYALKAFYSGGGRCF